MDTIEMDGHPFLASGAETAVNVMPQRGRMLTLVRRKANPFPERVFGPLEVEKRAQSRRLRTPVRRAIIGYRASFVRQNRPSGDPP